MKELEIKALLRQTINSESIQEKSTVLEELKLAGGKVIADLAKISDTLECFEIKSEKDSLRRLLKQGWYYGRVFDQVYLVCASKHLVGAKNLIPDWWGIMEVTNEGDIISIRCAKNNPNQDVNALAELLSKEELESLLERNNSLKGYKGKSLSALRTKLLEVYNTSAIKGLLCQTLIARRQDHFLTHT